MEQKIIKMKISEHLDLSELIRSESAKRNGILNMPTEEHLANFKLLAEHIFEPIRNNFRVPIHISSGEQQTQIQALKARIETLEK